MRGEGREGGGGMDTHVAFSLTLFPRLSLDYKPVPGTIDAGAQVQQIINVECLGVFLEAPVMKVSFR